MDRLALNASQFQILAQRVQEKLRGLRDTLPDYSLIPERCRIYVERVRAVFGEAAAVKWAKVLENLTYISAGEIIDAVDRMVEELNAKKQPEERWALLIPEADQENIWLKSNAWVSGIAAATLQFEYLLAAGCPGSLLNLEKDVQILLFDDCMYSGTQVLSFLETAKGLGHQGFACVPFVHQANQLQVIHPYVREQVRSNSARLKLAKTIDEAMEPHMDMLSNYTYKKLTLTYLQTKTPDFQSFPFGLLEQGNPFQGFDMNPKYEHAQTSWRYRDVFNSFQMEHPDKVSLINNCIVDDIECPPPAYKPLLLNVFGKSCPLLHDTLSESLTPTVQPPTQSLTDFLKAGLSQKSFPLFEHTLVAASQDEKDLLFNWINKYYEEHYKFKTPKDFLIDVSGALYPPWSANAIDIYYDKHRLEHVFELVGDFILKAVSTNELVIPEYVFQALQSSKPFNIAKTKDAITFLLQLLEYVVENDKLKPVGTWTIDENINYLAESVRVTELYKVHNEMVTLSLSTDPETSKCEALLAQAKHLYELVL